MEKGDVLTVVAISGDYVGKLLSMEDATVELENPRMILSNPQDGSMGFAKGLAATGEESPTSAVFQQVVFVVPSNEKVANAHLEATSGLTLVKG